MSLYHYTHLSPITKVQFKYANDRPPIGLIAAQPGISNERLNPLRRALEAEQWQCVPTQIEGKPYLQVSGFADEGQLIAYLKVHHFAQGTPQHQAEPGDHPTRTWQEWLQDSSMKACGWSYIVGDVALLISGLMSKRGKETMSGLLYTAGGAVLAKYGNIKTEHHVRNVSERMADFIKTQAPSLPDDCGLFTVLKEKNEGLLPSLDRFLTRYPSQVVTTLYATGAFAMLQSGLKYKKGWDTTYGAITTTAPFASMMIPEKPKEEIAAQPSDNWVGSVFNWIQEKPLRLTGYAYMVGALALGMSALKEYKENPRQKSYIFKFITTGTYLVGDLMLALSNKDHTNADGKFDADEQRRIEALAAEAIIYQPKDMRAALAHHVAGFLATQPEMIGNAASISEAILTQIEQMRDNPWVCRTHGSTALIQPGRQ